MSKIRIHPLTADRWSDLARLFGKQGVGGGCWCMYWRCETRQQYIQQKGRINKNAMRSLLRKGSIPGILAYADADPVGWCAVAPREEYPSLERSPSRKAIDEERVWSITCVYVARSHRRRGLSLQLINEAVALVRSQGGQVVESYPVPPKPGITGTSYAFTGFESTFRRAGFTEVCRRTKTRPIMRYKIPTIINR